jgi:membrane-bound metal-dependent hydrolase YbcI (DUF457 family)
MFVGHGLIAFAIAAAVADRRGWPGERALVVGVVAGLFATLPDVDMIYAVVGLAATGDPVGAETFWSVATVVHRTVTHSLVVGGLAAVTFGAWRAREDRRSLAVAAALAATLLSAVWTVSGPLAAAVTAVFLGAGLVVVWLARAAGFGHRVVLAAALVGLLTHPFGDLLTGQPPGLLYPFGESVVAERVALHPDPTLHLLGAFFVELATVWLALAVVVRLRGWQLRSLIRPRAALGVGYAGAAAVFPAPTLAVSWPFVFSVLAVGVIAAPVRDPGGERPWTAAVATGLAAVTLAALAYTVTYLLA